MSRQCWAGAGEWLCSQLWGWRDRKSGAAGASVGLAHPRLALVGTPGILQGRRKLLELLSSEGGRSSHCYSGISPGKGQVT